MVEINNNSSEILKIEKDMTIEAPPLRAGSTKTDLNLGMVRISRGTLGECVLKNCSFVWQL